MSLTLFACIFALFINQSLAKSPACGQPIGEGSLSPEQEALYLSRFPWHVVVNNKIDGKSCGATLVSNKHIVVAAHCVISAASDSLEVTLNDKSTAKVSAIAWDDRYNAKDGAYDFAVLVLESETKLMPICLRGNRNNLMPASYLMSHVAGKNIDGYGATVDGSRCDTSPTESQICVMVMPKNGAECAEGSFMSQDSNRRYYLDGFTSRCLPSGDYALYTNAAKYNIQDWIKNFN